MNDAAIREARKNNEQIKTILGFVFHWAGGAYCEVFRKGEVIPFEAINMNRVPFTRKDFEAAITARLEFLSSGDRTWRVVFEGLADEQYGPKVEDLMKPDTLASIRRDVKKFDYSPTTETIRTLINALEAANRRIEQLERQAKA